MARPKTFRLSDRDFDIFEHLSRYRMTTREVLHRLFWEDSEINAVSKVTSRLVHFGFLNRYELYPRRPYFRLGPPAARLLGINAKHCKPLGVQDRPIEFGILDFCCGGEDRRKRLKVRDVAKDNPDLLSKNLLSNRYYIDDDNDTKRLGFVHVDCSGDAAHVARSCNEQLEKRYVHEAFRQLIDQDRFVIAIVMATEAQKESITDALNRRTWPHPVPFRLHVAPDLTHLICRLNTF